MEEKVKQAENLFLQGYNCSQSVFAAFSEEVGLDRETALRLSSSFGGGMARLREVCGAVTAMFMVAGLKDGYSDPTDAAAKAEHYQRIQDLAKKFQQENGSIICRELLGLPSGADCPIPEARTPNYYQKRPCAELVKCAAKIIDEYLGGIQNMKIAVTTQGEQIFQHFGKCPTFTIFTVENGTIQGKDVVDASQNGHAALANFLKSKGVDVLICGGIGGGAKQMLSSVGIKLISGIEGNIENAVNTYLAGQLSDMGGTCNHEEHEHDHVCDCKNHCN